MNSRRGLLFVLIVMALVWALPVLAQDGEMLLEDSFNSNANGWKLATKGDKLRIAGGKLLITVNGEESAGWVTPDRKFPDDIEVSVDVQVPAGQSGDDWNAALLLRADARDTNTAFYQFEIAGTGEWAFVTRTAKGEKYEVAKSGKLTDFLPNEVHNLAIVARGSEFTFSVNAVEVGTFKDSTINNNDDDKYIGLLTGTFKGQPAVTAEFANLKVIQGGGGANKAVLFEEDFANNDNQWTVSKTLSGTSALDDGVFTVKINKGSDGGLLRWYRPGKSTTFPADIDTSVTVTPDVKASEGTWYYGIGVRYYAQGDNYYAYFVAVTGAGKWAFARLDGDKVTTLTDLETIKNFKVDQPHRLRLVAVGDEFTFYLDDRKLGSTTDSELKLQKNNQVILLADASDADSTIRVSFDDFVVAQAE
jgi:hypothetical protein